MPRHFIALSDHTAEDLRRYLDLAKLIKLNPRAFARACEGLTLAMIFQKPSLRTRVSFHVGMSQLGGQAINLGPKDIQLHRGESVADTAAVLGRYVDGVMARLFAHQDLLDLAAVSRVPVINGLTDFNHPVQVLADLQTIDEKLCRLEGLKLAYIGDGNNMAHSLLSGCSIMGMHVAVGHPEGYAPDAKVVAMAREQADHAGGSVLITGDPAEAIADADVVYTDTWTSMGQEAEAAERLARFQGFQINEALLRYARPRAIFMHCLPGHRGEEVSAEVMDGPRSVIFDQAENRLHAQKAIMVHLMGHKR
jgi:ornithine carbamoyltransferase